MSTMNLFLGLSLFLQLIHYPSSALVQTIPTLLYYFISKLLNLSCPSDVLISNPVHPDYSHYKNLNIFNSATSGSASCLLDSAAVSTSYIIAGFTTVF